MKKTMKTAMTAAMFAAAIGIGQNTANTSGVSAVDTLPEDQLMEATEDIPQDVYGPPSWFEEETDVTTEPVAYGTEAPVTTTEMEPIRLEGEATVPTDEYPVPEGTVPIYDLTTTEPVPETMEVLYGPPYVFFKKGDITMDNSVDARDLSVLKQALLEGKNVDWLRELGDVNGDGVFDEADIRELRRQLLGRSVEEDEEAEQTAEGTTVTTTGTTSVTTTKKTKPGKKETTTTMTTTTTTTTEMITETLYGPPYQTTVQPVYGPPSYFE